MSSQTQIKDRVKPSLPQHLQKYFVLYTRLRAPYGPEYLVDQKAFVVDRLSKEWINYIKEEQVNYTPAEMCKHLALDYNLAVRTEAIAQHYYRARGVKFWQVEKSSYVKAFEKQWVQRGVDSEQVYMQLYKPFVEFLIQSGYEFSQIGTILGRTPVTIRMWANRWGYKEHTRITTKVPNLKNNKESRTEVIADPDNKIMADPSTNSIKVYDTLAQESVPVTWKSVKQDFSLAFKHLVALVFRKR